MDTLLELAHAYRVDSRDPEIDDFYAGYNLGMAHGLERGHDLILRAEVDRAAS